MDRAYPKIFRRLFVAGPLAPASHPRCADISSKFLFAAGLIEISVLLAWLKLQSLVLPLALHLCAVALVIFYFCAHDRLRSRMDPYRPMKFYGFVLCAFFPVVGMPFFIFFYATAKFFPQPEKQKCLYFEMEKPTAQPKASKDRTGKYRDLNIYQLWRAVNTESFADIMAGEDVRLKARVVEKLYKIQNQESIKLLQKAINDPAPEIKFYAAGVLLKIDPATNESIQQGHREAGYEREKGGSP